MVGRVRPELITIPSSSCRRFTMPSFLRIGHATKRNGHIVYVMDKRSWRQAGAVIVVRDPGKEALANVWKLGLDIRKVKQHLAVHPDLDRPGEITARGDHDLEEHPLSDGNSYRRGVSPTAGFSVVRAIRRSQAVRTPGEHHRVA